MTHQVMETIDSAGWFKESLRSVHFETVVTLELTISEEDPWQFLSPRTQVSDTLQSEPVQKKRWDVSRMHTLRWKVSRRGHVATTIEEFALRHIWQLVIYPCGSQVLLIQIIVVPYLILRCSGAYQLMNYLQIHTFSRLKEKQDENSLSSVLQRKVTLCSSKEFDNWSWYLG